MLELLPTDLPLPPVTWDTPLWHEDDAVTVKSERLGESPIFFRWSPRASEHWARQNAPSPGALPGMAFPNVELLLQAGVVTLKVDGKVQPLPFGDIKVTARHPRKPWIALIGASPRHPPQPAVWDVAHQRFLTPLREVSTGPLGESVNWQSIDGFPLQGFFFAAQDPEAPLCLLVHDGPIRAVRAGWPDKARALTAAGAHACYVNYRGSEGLSVSPEEALRAVWGEKDVWDLISAKNHLLAAGKVTSRRFALWGGRAGGFGVLNTVARYANAFDTAIAVYPLLDPLAAARRMGDTKRLNQWQSFLGPRGSRLMNAQLSPPKTSVHVYHGKEDPEVPYTEVENWVAQRQRDGWSIRLTGFEGMGRRFSQLRQWQDYHQEAVRLIAGEPSKSSDRL